MSYYTVLYCTEVLHFVTVRLRWTFIPLFAWSHFSHHTHLPWRLDDWSVKVGALYCGEGGRLVFEENEKCVVLIGYFFGYKCDIHKTNVSPPVFSLPRNIPLLKTTLSSTVPRALTIMTCTIGSAVYFWASALRLTQCIISWQQHNTQDEWEGCDNDVIVATF